MNNSRVWLCVMVGACTAAGCATSTYRIPATEMLRLAALDDGQRGDVVRVMPADPSTRVYAALPDQAVAPAPTAAPPDAALPSSVSADPAPPLADAEAPPPDEQAAPEPAQDDGAPVDGPNLQIQGGGEVNVNVSAHPRPPVLYVAPVPVRHPVAPVVHGGAGRHFGGGHGGGGHFHGGGGHGLHLGGGHSGGGALVALVAAIVVVGAVVAIADARSDPPSYDGWAQIRPDHPLHLFYRSGAQRVIRLRDLRPTDLLGLADTILKDSDGRVSRLAI